MMISNDQLMISNAIGNANPDSTNISRVTDHPIAKNASKNSQNILEKNNDRMISNSSNPDTEPISITDHLTDRLPIAKSDDRLLSDRVNKRSHSESLANQQTQNLEVSDRQSDQVTDHRDRVSDRIPKAKYRYAGKDWVTEQKCLKAGYLEIVRIEGNEAIVTNPKWRVTDRIPLKDLKRISDR